LEEPDQGLRVGQGRESVRQAALISHIPGGGFKRPKLLITLYVQYETPFEEFIGPESGRAYEISDSVEFRGEVSFEVTQHEDIDSLMSLGRAAPLGQTEGELLGFNLLRDLLTMGRLIGINRMLHICYGLFNSHDC
jgi:hypothetical protein